MSGNERRWVIIGVASSAGAMTPGVEKAPKALREAGLIEGLRRSGARVRDLGDIAESLWQPSSAPDDRVDEVARVAALVRDSVYRVAAGGETALVLGGDCTITVGVTAGVALAGGKVGVLYVDGGPDLYLPDDDSGSHLDSTGMSHLLHRDGAGEGLASIADQLPADRLVIFGDSLPHVNDHEARVMRDLGIKRVTCDEIHANPVAAAARALTAMESAADSFVLHVDVDVLDFQQVPLADIPNAEGRPLGLSQQELMQSIRSFVRSPGCRAVVITEINTDHAPDEDVLPGFVAELAEALAG